MTVDVTVDVIVAGGGMAGLAAAEALARRGRSVALIERYEPGHQRGGSHGDGRVVRYSYTDPLYMTMAQATYPMWDELAKRAGRTLVETTGGVDFGPAGSESLRAIVENCEQLGLPYEVIDRAHLSDRFPPFGAFDDDEIIYQPSSGVALADRVVTELWRLGRELGVEQITGDPISAAGDGDNGIEVTTASGLRIAAEQLVVTAGNWSNRLLGLFELRPVDYEARQVQVSHFVPTTDQPHTVGHLPIFIDHRNYLYGLPEIRTPGVKLGAHEDGTALDDVDQVLPVDRATVDKMTDYVSRRFPHLDPAPATTYTCRYTTTANHRFVLARHPDSARVVVGTGFCGEGFKFTPLIGAVLADLVDEAPPPFDLGEFGL